MTSRKIFSLVFVLSVGLILSACSEARYAAHVVKQIPLPGEQQEHVGYFKVGNTYRIKGRKYYPKETYNKTETGVASWYGPNFHGKMTANGEIFDQNELTAAHRTLQMPSIIRVTNLRNGRTIILRVNDRGPFAHDRVLDVSKRAAEVLGFKNQGTTKVRIEVLGEASREVAYRAKNGQSTKGFEVALNQTNGRMQPRPISRTPDIKPQTLQPVTQLALSSPNITTTPAGNVVSQPVPLKKPAPVEAVSLSAPPTPPTLGAARIYVQAGAFSQEQNALNFSTKMASYGPSKVYLTQLNNQPFYRVRLGPYNDRESASRVLDVLRQGGNNQAVIVTD